MLPVWGEKMKTLHPKWQIRMGCEGCIQATLTLRCLNVALQHFILSELTVHCWKHQTSTVRLSLMCRRLHSPRHRHVTFCLIRLRRQISLELSLNFYCLPGKKNMSVRENEHGLEYASFLFLPHSFEWQPNALQGNKCGPKSNYIFIQSKFTNNSAVQVRVAFLLSAAMWEHMQYKLRGSIKMLRWII